MTRHRRVLGPCNLCLCQSLLQHIMLHWHSFVTEMEVRSATVRSALQRGFVHHLAMQHETKYPAAANAQKQSKQDIEKCCQKGEIRTTRGCRCSLNPSDSSQFETCQAGGGGWGNVQAPGSLDGAQLLMSTTCLQDTVMMCISCQTFMSCWCLSVTTDRLLGAAGGSSSRLYILHSTVTTCSFLPSALLVGAV